MLIKFCGARTPAEVDVLAAAGADLVGLWHGVPGGRADLSLPRLCALAEAAHARPPLAPVLVTLRDKVAAVRAAVGCAAVSWVQLHGYQPPSFVRALKESTDATVIKVLHVRAGDCPERALIPAYERAGTDLFLFDSTTADGRVGSTGRRLEETTLLDLVERMSRPFLLAGGITADNRHEFGELTEHPGFRGVDVDSAARDEGGGFSPQRVEAISRTWRVARERGAA